MGRRQGRISVWVVAFTSFAFPSLLWAQEEMPPGKRALFDASDKAKTVPLDQGVKLYEQVIAQFPDTVYAGQALLNIGSLYPQNKLPEKALTNAEQALEEYGETYLAGQAIRRKFVTLANSLNQPQDALDFLVCIASNGDPDDRVKLRPYPERQFVDSSEPCTDQQEAICTIEGLARVCGEYGGGPKIDGGCPAAACPAKLDTSNGSTCSMILQGPDAAASAASLAHPCPHVATTGSEGGGPWADNAFCHVAM
jgi:hypothetical protein